MPLVECVPNFSEGKNRATIDAIARAISAVPDVILLDIDPSADTNRTVYTFIGPPHAVKQAALAAATIARTHIDMRVHKGAHPRIGALDVCPFVPVADISMEECVQLSKEFARELAQMLDVPVFLYENLHPGLSVKALLLFGKANMKVCHRSSRILTGNQITGQLALFQSGALQ